MDSSDSSSDSSYESTEELPFFEDSNSSDESSSSLDEISIVADERGVTQESQNGQQSRVVNGHSPTAPSEGSQQMHQLAASSAEVSTTQGREPAEKPPEPANAVQGAPLKPSGATGRSGLDISDILGSGRLDLRDILSGGRLDLGDMLRTMLRKGSSSGSASSDSSGERKIKRAVEGIKVVRGPDWNWGDQDKGEGQVGTIRIMKDREGVVQVAWDHGATNDYSAGYKGKHDLFIFDNAQVGVKHRDVSCDECKESGIWGMRWKCHICPEFNLCTRCYMKDKHMEHVFRRILKPGSPSVLLPPRQGSSKVTAQGLFEQARVVRGEDWKYPNQDGGPGSVGTITGITDFSDSSAERNGAAVMWDINQSNKYRVGYHGYCDLKYVKPAIWGDYYPLHLPILNIGELIPPEGSAEAGASGSGQADDNFKVEIISGISGTRVIRGPDWEWGNQDNGPFNMGTVEGTDTGHSGLDTCVYWDHGHRARYRSGAIGKFDLKIVDNAPAKVVHKGKKCDGCGENPLYGIRWKCLTCSSVNLCTQCYGDNKHSLSHPFSRLLNLDSTAGVKVPPRLGVKREQLQGIFLGATVVRGPDWDWGEQDGKAGTSGKVVDTHTARDDEDASHCWWHVKWQGKIGANAYRLGLNGCIDIKAVEPVKGYYVYPDHLPNFEEDKEVVDEVPNEGQGRPEVVDVSKEDSSVQVPITASASSQTDFQHVFPLEVQGCHNKFRIHRSSDEFSD